MEISAGLLIIQDNKILLGHPTSAPYYGSYTIPKGKVEAGETHLTAALRETKEEVGIEIDINDIINIDNPFLIDYKDEKGKIYKKLYYFVVQPKEKIIIDENKLQKKEIDYAGFFNLYDSMSRIFWRYEEEKY